MRKGKLYWISGQLPGEGKIAVVADSSMIRMLDKAASDFPMGSFDRPYYHGGAKMKMDSNEVMDWFKKWFGVVTKPRGEEGV